MYAKVKNQAVKAAQESFSLLSSVIPSSSSYISAIPSLLPPGEELEAVFLSVCKTLDKLTTSNCAKGEAVDFVNRLVGNKLNRIVQLLKKESEDRVKWGKNRTQSSATILRSGSPSTVRNTSARNEDLESSASDIFTTPCLDLYLQAQMTRSLCRYASIDTPRGVLPLILRCLTLLISRVRFPVLLEQSVHRPLGRLIALATRIEALTRRPDDSDREWAEYKKRVDARLVVLCSLLWKKIAQNKPVLEFFATVELVPSSARQVIVQLDILGALAPLVNRLRTGRMARETILVAVALNDEAVNTFIVHNTRLCHDVVADAARCFALLLRQTSSLLESRRELDTAESISNALAREGHLQSSLEGLMRALRFCNAMIKTSRAGDAISPRFSTQRSNIIQRRFSRLLHELLFTPLLAPALTHTSETESSSACAIVSEILVSFRAASTSPLLELLCRFIIDGTSDTPGMHIQAPLLQLVSHASSVARRQMSSSVQLLALLIAAAPLDAAGRMLAPIRISNSYDDRSTSLNEGRKGNEIIDELSAILSSESDATSGNDGSAHSSSASSTCQMALSSRIDSCCAALDSSIYRGDPDKTRYVGAAVTEILSRLSGRVALTPSSPLHTASPTPSPKVAWKSNKPANSISLQSETSLVHSTLRSQGSSNNYAISGINGDDIGISSVEGTVMTKLKSFFSFTRSNQIVLCALVRNTAVTYCALSLSACLDASADQQVERGGGPEDVLSPSVGCSPSTYFSAVGNILIELEYLQVAMKSILISVRNVFRKLSAVRLLMLSLNTAHTASHSQSTAASSHAVGSGESVYGDLIARHPLLRDVPASELRALETSVLVSELSAQLRGCVFAVQRLLDDFVPMLLPTVSSPSSSLNPLSLIPLRRTISFGNDNDEDYYDDYLEEEELKSPLGSDGSRRRAASSGSRVENDFLFEYDYLSQNLNGLTSSLAVFPQPV